MGYAPRWIAEKLIGRPIRSDEVVHHIDGNRLNNDPSNLLVCTRSWHYSIHLTTRQRHTQAVARRRAAIIREILSRQPEPEQLQLSFLAPPAPSPLDINCECCRMLEASKPRLWDKKYR